MDFPADGSVKIFTGNLFGVQADSLKDSYIMRMAQSMRFTAFLPGDADLGRVGKLIEAGVPVTAANLEALKGRQIPHYIKAANEAGQSVVIIGIYSEATFGLLDKETAGKWKLKDGKTSLREALEEAGESDWVVVMTAGDEEWSKRVLDSFGEVDLVLCANSAGRNIQPGDRGYVLNIPRKPVQAGYIELLDTKNSSQKHTRAGLGKNNSISITQFSPAAAPEAKALVDEYYAKWYADLVERRGNNPAPDKVFLGSQFCGKCHISEYESWRKSRHSHAYEQIKRGEKRCIPCHTTGFGYPTGFWDWETTPKLAGVGCEECHMVSKNPPITGAHKSVKVSADNCRCHTAPHDNNFNYEIKKAKIKQEHR